MYLSLSTLSSSFSMIFRVVSTPISEVINASSIPSRANSSIVDLPATVLANFPKKLSLVFLSPESSFSFSLLKFNSITGSESSSGAGSGSDSVSSSGSSFCMIFSTSISDNSFSFLSSFDLNKPLTLSNIPII